jgi:integrase
MDADILALWPDLPVVHRFLLATGQGLREIVSMDWTHLDPRTRVWIQPDSNADVSHTIIIPEWVMSWLPERTGSPAVFIGDDGARFSPATASSLLMNHVNAIGIEDITAHDLRAYALKQLGELGSPGLAGKAPANIAQRQQRSSCAGDQAGVEADLLEKWSQRLQEVVLEGGTTIGDTPLSNSH